MTKDGDEAPTGDVEAPEIDEERDAEFEEWSADTSVQAVRAREDNLTGAAAKLVMAEDAELNMNERLELFFKYVKDKLQEVDSLWLFHFSMLSSPNSLLGKYWPKQSAWIARRKAS